MIVRAVERWARRLAIVAAVLAFDSDRVVLFALVAAIVIAIGYACARYAGRRRVELFGHKLSASTWNRHARDHLIGWLIVFVAFVLLAERWADGSFPTVLLGLWSLGFIAGDFVHRRTSEGMREQMLQIAADSEREEIDEAVKREWNHAGRFASYDDYLRDRASLLLTRKEFDSARLDHTVNLESENDGPI